MSVEIEKIAQVCHEANRAWCEANGDTSHFPWEEAPEWQRDSSRSGVAAALEGTTAEELHKAWKRHKVEDGWTYGPIKDSEKKTHPCIVESYDDLPDFEKIKDDIFNGIVSAFGRRP